MIQLTRVEWWKLFACENGAFPDWILVAVVCCCVLLWCVWCEWWLDKWVSGVLHTVNVACARCLWRVACVGVVAILARAISCSEPSLLFFVVFLLHPP